MYQTPIQTPTPIILPYKSCDAEDYRKLVEEEAAEGSLFVIDLNLERFEEVGRLSTEIVRRHVMRAIERAEKDDLEDQAERGCQQRAEGGGDGESQT